MRARPLNTTQSITYTLTVCVIFNSIATYTVAYIKKAAYHLLTLEHHIKYPIPILPEI
jgi:hypothetical protein